MTSPNGPILFNSSTGSDSAASGLGPSTAVTGAGASTTATSAVVTGIDTTGVTAGDLLWVQSSSGRQFSIIASVDSGSQVTCDDTFANTESSRTWAIGGKRATFDETSSRLLFADDLHEFWTLETETDQTLTSQLGGSFDISYTLVGSPGAIRTITQTGGAAVHAIQKVDGVLVVKNLKFENSGPGSSSCSAIRSAGKIGGRVSVAIDCVFGDPVNTIGFGLHGYNARGGFAAYNCLFQHTQNDAISSRAGGHVFVSGCRFVSCAVGIDAYGSVSLFHNVFDGSSVNAGALLVLHASGNVFYNSPSFGLRIYGGDRASLVHQNIFVNNGTYGVDIETSDEGNNLIQGNAYFSNTSGQIEASLAQQDAITLTADPFVDAASGDFNINDTAGGGALLRAATLEIPS